MAEPLEDYILESVRANRRVWRKAPWNSAASVSAVAATMEVVDLLVGEIDRLRAYESSIRNSSDCRTCAGYYLLGAGCEECEGRE